MSCYDGEDLIWGWFSKIVSPTKVDFYYFSG